MVKSFDTYFNRSSDNTWRKFKGGASGGTGGTGGPPVTGSWSGLKYGADDTYFDDLNAKVDGKLQIRRFYLGNFPSTIPAMETQDFNRGVIPYVSFADSPAAIISGSRDANIAAYFGASTQKKLVTWLHEPDHDKATAADFKAAHKRIMSIKRANCPNNSEVLFGPTLMGWAFTSDYFRDWIIPADCDYLGSDPYRFWRPRYSPTIGTASAPSPKTGSLGTKRSMQFLLGSLPQYAADNGNLPLVVGEFAAHPDPENIGDRAAWLQETHDYFLRTNHIAACYFHTRYGEDGPWYIDRFHTFSGAVGSAERDLGPADPTSLAKFRSFLPA